MMPDMNDMGRRVEVADCVLKYWKMVMCAMIDDGQPDIVSSESPTIQFVFILSKLIWPGRFVPQD